MSALEPLCRLIGIDPQKLSREEFLILEGELFYNICEELKEIFRKQYKEYFRLSKFTLEMENSMLEQNYLRFVFNDILSTQEYTLEGLAYYVGSHADVVYEVILGSNFNPSAILLHKAIALHRSLRGDLYKTIIKKIVEKYSVAA